MLKNDIHPSYISKYNLNHENQIILLIISNGEGWSHHVVKRRMIY